MDPQQAAVASEFDSYRDRYEETVNRAGVSRLTLRATFLI